MVEPAPVRGRLRRAGVRTARRDDEETDDERARTTGLPRTGSVSRRSRSDTKRITPLIDDLSLTVTPAGRSRSWTDRGGQDHARQSRHAVLRTRCRTHHARRCGHRPMNKEDLRRRSGWCYRTPGCSKERSGQHRLGRLDSTKDEILEAARPPSSIGSSTAPRRLRRGGGRRTANISADGEAADHDRPGVPGDPGAADPRQGDQVDRRPTELLLPAR